LFIAALIGDSGWMAGLVKAPPVVGTSGADIEDAARAVGGQDPD
jgi:hypothetical protein